MTNRRDVRLFLYGQVISNLGSSFTMFALPLLVFQLTGSAINLAVTTVTGYLPYLLFGLIAGAWVDRVDRRKAMIGAELTRGLALATIPCLALAGTLSVWWVYILAFTNTSMSIVTKAVESTAVPALVDKEELTGTNGKLQASYAIAQVLGPLLAGALVGGGLTVPGVFAFDAASFVASAVTVLLIRTPFNADRAPAKTSVREDIATGLRYVLAHPLLRNIALLAGLFNLVAVTVWSQLVLFAHTRLNAGDAQVSLLFAGSSLGTAVMMLTAGRLNKRISFRAITLGAPLCWGALVFVLAFNTSFWWAVVLWSAAGGLPLLFAIRTLTLRQAIVPEHLLGRVQTIAAVLAWSAQPLGALAGAWIIEVSGQISLVYAGIALIVLLITTSFCFGPLGKPDRDLLPADQTVS